MDKIRRENPQKRTGSRRKIGPFWRALIVTLLCFALIAIGYFGAGAVNAVISALSPS